MRRGRSCELGGAERRGRGGNGFLSIANHDDFKIGTGDFLMAAVAKIVTGNGPININVTNASRRSKRT